MDKSEGGPAINSNIIPSLPRFHLAWGDELCHIISGIRPNNADRFANTTNQESTKRTNTGSKRVCVNMFSFLSQKTFETQRWSN